MAPSRAVRSTSRRNTPISPLKVAGPISSSRHPARQRSTRSQSRDVSLESDQQADLASRTLKERKDNRVPEPVLDPVPENAEVEYPELYLSDTSDSSINLDDDEYDESSSAHGGITSHTQHELSKLDQESMANALPFLHQYSDSLLSLFSSGDAAQLERLHRDLQDPTSRASKKLNTFLEGFMLNRKYYGDDMLIDLDTAVRALAGLRQADKIPDRPWRPDAALYMANLAHYLSSIYASNEQSEDAREFLNSIFNSFPAPFGPVFNAEARHQDLYSSDLVFNHTLSVVLEIRTQYLLQQLSQMQEHPAFDPDETVRPIFYVDHDRLRGPDCMDDLSVLPSTFQAIFTQRITAIRGHFSSEISNPVDFDGLRQAFPYASFLVHLAQWAQLMAKQHKYVITAHGGITQIQSQLQGEFERRQSGEKDNLMTMIQSRSAERQEGAQRDDRGIEVGKVVTPTGGPDSARTPAPSSPNKAAASKAMKKKSQPRKSLEWRAKQQQTLNKMRTKSRARKAANAAEKAQETLPAEVQAPARDIQSGGDDAPILPSPPRMRGVPAPSQQRLTVLKTLRTHAAQSNKENIDNSRGGKQAFIDRQPGAERVTFDSQDEILGVSERSSTKRKAPETEGDEEDDEDDDFEVDLRSVHPVSHRQVSTQSQRLGEKSRSSKAAVNEHISRGSPSKRARVEHARREAINDGEDEAEEEEEEEEDDDDDDNVAASSQLQREEANRNRHRSTSNVPPDRRPPLQERHNIPSSSSAPGSGSSAVPLAGTQVTVISHIARQNTAKRPTKARPQQLRSRWTEAEVERLVQLIEDHGVSWANLLKLDHRYPGGAKLQQRDQVSLKDKARNMKMDFLKAGIDLPSNFEHIILGSRLIGMLKAYGVRHNGR